MSFAALRIDTVRAIGVGEPLLSDIEHNALTTLCALCGRSFFIIEGLLISMKSHLSRSRKF